MRTKFFFLSFCFYFMVLSLNLSAQQMPQFFKNQLLGTQSGDVSDKAGYYSAKVPSQYFNCHSGPEKVQCVGRLHVQATLSIEVTDVPKTATAGLVALNQVQAFQKSQSTFKMLNRVQKKIDKNSVVVQSFTYNELNNISLPVWVESLFAVSGTKLITMKAWCRSIMCNEYRRGIDQILNSFKLAPLDKSGKPINGSLSTPSADPFSKAIEELDS